jgi:hypothetical protein
MANKRRLQREKRLEKIYGQKDSYYTAKNNIESVGSESSRGESFDSGYQEIIQEENDGDDDEIDDVESNEPEIDCKVGDKVIAPAITSNSDASYSSSFQGEVIEIEGKKARVQRCLSKQHKLWYNIGSLRRPDTEELKDIKVKGKRMIAEVVSRKKDEMIKKLQVDVRDKAELKKVLRKERSRYTSLEAKQYRMENQNKVVMENLGNMDIEVFSVIILFIQRFTAK